MDSRTSSILLNLNLNLDTSKVANKYLESKSDIEEAEKGYKVKEYNTLASALKECYLTGCVKYGNNFVV